MFIVSPFGLLGEKHQNLGRSNRKSDSENPTVGNSKPAVLDGCYETDQALVMSQTPLSESLLLV